MNAQAAVIAHLTAENEKLTAEVLQLRATVVLDADRIKRLLAAQPVLRNSLRMGRI